MGLIESLINVPRHERFTSEVACLYDKTPIPLLPSEISIYPTPGRMKKGYLVGEVTGMSRMGKSSLFEFLKHNLVSQLPWLDVDLHPESETMDERVDKYKQMPLSFDSYSHLVDLTKLLSMHHIVELAEISARYHRQVISIVERAANCTLSTTRFKAEPVKKADGLQLAELRDVAAKYSPDIDFVVFYVGSLATAQERRVKDGLEASGRAVNPEKWPVLFEKRI